MPTAMFGALYSDKTFAWANMNTHTVHTIQIRPYDNVMLVAPGRYRRMSPNYWRLHVDHYGTEEREFSKLGIKQPLRRHFKKGCEKLELTFHADEREEFIDWVLKWYPVWGAEPITGGYPVDCFERGLTLAGYAWTTKANTESRMEKQQVNPSNKEVD